MCGIAGFSLSADDLAIVNPATLTKRLALSIEHRGRDATGVAFRHIDDVRYTKAPVTATQFIRDNGHKVVARDAHHAMIHTRAWTTGSPSDNNNNHPIPIDPFGDKPGLIGTHNGCIWNDGTIWRRYPHLDQRRKGEVDSEAIFALFQSYGLNGIAELTGDASIAWVSEDSPDRLHFAKLGGRPLAVAFTRGGSVLYASEAQCLDDVFSHFRQLLVEEAPFMLNDGEHIAVEHGSVVEYDKDYPVISYKGRTFTTGGRSSTTSAWEWWDDDDHYHASAPTPLTPATTPKAEPKADTTDAAPTEADRRLVRKLCPWWVASENQSDEDSDIDLMLELLYTHCGMNALDKAYDEVLADLNIISDEAASRETAALAIRDLAEQIGDNPDDESLYGMGDWEGVSNA